MSKKENHKKQYAKGYICPKKKNHKKVFMLFSKHDLALLVKTVEILWDQRHYVSLSI